MGSGQDLEQESAAHEQALRELNAKIEAMNAQLEDLSKLVGFVCFPWLRCGTNNLFRTRLERWQRQQQGRLRCPRCRSTAGPACPWRRSPPPPAPEQGEAVCVCACAWLRVFDCLG